MPPTFTESIVEEAALEWLVRLGYTRVYGPDIAPKQPAAERTSFREVVLLNRLRDALKRLNPTLPPVALEEAERLLQRTDTPNLIINNHNFHKLLLEGVSVSYPGAEGRIIYTTARVVDFTNWANNDWVAVNQFSIRIVGTLESQSLEGTRRPDIILYVNGLPLAVIELKNLADEKATVEQAYNQLQAYKQQIPDLFVYNETLVIADGLDARIGTLTADFEWFKPWRSVDGNGLEEGRPRLETLIRGVFDPRRYLDIVRFFVLFETQRDQTIKKMAGYHQYFAANKAVVETLRAVGAVEGGKAPEGAGRAGVIWHTQGSGKSLTMLFYAGKIVQEPRMSNPTLVVLTDRNDLDDQLLDNTFAPGYELLRQTPTQAADRNDLREKLNVPAGGVIFTTIQKFMPDPGDNTNATISDRRNIVFIVDEAHRTQYGFDARYIRDQDKVRQVYGLAKYMRDALPNATFIGFTGTPVSAGDRSTRNVFGEYIDIYDLQRAVNDKATVPIYYDARHARMKMDEVMVPRIDPEFEEITEGEEETQVVRLQSKWARIAAVVGAPDRIELLAQDIVRHYEERNAALHGKAMIVCMTRDICVRMHDALIRLRPEWYHPDDKQGTLKVVMTGGVTDPPEWQQHIRTKPRRKEMAERFRKEDSGFNVVIVRDMWLTGFDAPSLHTMYVDKPMRGHNLMQAIARVNRVYPGKDGGLVVGYLPIETQLQEALRDYTEADQEVAGKYQDEAVLIMQEKFEIVTSMFYGFNYRAFFSQSPTEQLTVLSNAVDFIIGGRDELQRRYIDAVTALARAYALATPHEQALAIRDDLAFFQAVKSPLVKSTTSGFTAKGGTTQGLDFAVQQIVNRAYAPEGIISLFEVAGLEQPNVSLLSDEFMLEVKSLPQKNIALEILRRLLEDEIKAQRRTNLVQARSFSSMLQDALERYNSQTVSAMTVINMLLELAKDMRQAKRRGEDLGLSETELAFFDALAANQSAVEVMGDNNLAVIARELVIAVRKNTTIDWNVQETARAKMRVAIKRILRQYGYPPDLANAATETVVQQAELFAETL